MPTDRQIDRLLLSGGAYAPQSYGGGSDITRLILEQGRQRAAAAQQQGEIWGNALQQAGAQISGGLEKAAEEKKLKKRDAAWLAVMNDPEAWKSPQVIATKAHQMFGPEGDKMFQAAVAAHQLTQPKRDQAADQKALVAFHKGFKVLDPAAREASWPMVRPMMGGAFGTEVPEKYDDAQYTNVWGPAIEGLEKPGEAKTREVKVRNADGTETTKIVEDRAGQDFTSAAPPKEVKAETRSLDVQAAEAMAKGDTATYQRLLKVKKEMGQADDRPRITVQTQPHWQEGQDEQGNPVLVDYNSGRTKPYPAGAMPKPGAAEANRIAAADAALNSSAQLKAYLARPEVRAAIGPIMGRYNSLAQAAGNGDPVAVELVATLKSYSALQPQIHGFRNVHFANDIEKLLSTHQTPESLAAALRGIDSAAINVRDRRRDTKGGAAADPLGLR